jgi:hypothetical protein
MNLTPREKDKLMIALAALVAGGGSQEASSSTIPKVSRL